MITIHIGVNITAFWKEKPLFSLGPAFQTKYAAFFVIKKNYGKIDLSVDTRSIYAHFISLVSRDFTLSRA